MQWEYHQQTFGHETTIIVKWILYIGAKNRCGYLVLVIGLIAKLLNFCLKKHQGGSIFRGAPSWMSLSDLFCDLFPLMFRAMNQVLDVWWILPLKSTQPTIYYIAGGSAVSSTFSTFHAAWNGQKVETSNLCSSKQLLRLDPFGLFLGSAHTHTPQRVFGAHVNISKPWDFPFQTNSCSYSPAGSCIQCDVQDVAGKKHRAATQNHHWHQFKST